MQKFLIAAGIILIATGLLWPFIIKLGLGHLPGDIYIKNKNFKFYFPITTCILISVIITFIIWLFKK